MLTFCNSLLALAMSSSPLVDPTADPCSWETAQAPAAASPVAKPRSAPPAAGTVPAPAAAPTAADVVVHLQSTYDGIQDYVAAFRQELTNAAAGETTSSQGTIYFKRPGKMRWDYATPTQKTLVTDGATLWIWEPAFQQYASVDVRRSSAPLALRFLMGQGRLNQDFDAAITRQQGARLTLELTPHASQGGVEQLQFVVDTATWTVAEAILLDPVGNVNHLYFSNARWNQRLPDSGFTFSPPAGAHRVDAPPGF